MTIFEMFSMTHKINRRKCRVENILSIIQKTINVLEGKNVIISLDAESLHKFLRGK